MKSQIIVLALICATLTSVHAAQRVEKLLPFAEKRAERIAQIEQMLPDDPQGLGRPISDRAAWDSIAAIVGRDSVINHANTVMNTAMVAWSDSLYLDFYKTGIRPPGEAMMEARHKRLAPLVLGECIENRGRFIPSIEATITELLSDPSWMRSAHDWNADAFHGRRNEVDLPVAVYSHTIAEAFYLLGDKLSADLRSRAIEVLRTKMFIPMQIALNKGDNNTAAWLVNTNNWNAVCLAGVTGTALSILPSKSERALYVAAAEYYSQSSLLGYTDDGFCSEGLGYFNYGFDHYITLREEIMQATAGRIDLFDSPKMRNISTYSIDFEINRGVYPANADCKIGTSVAPHIVWYCNRSLGLGIEEYNDLKIKFGTPQGMGSIVPSMLYLFPNSASQRSAVRGKSSTPMLRKYFDNAGVLICRPNTSTPNKSGTPQIAAAFKGGHNDEHHNHNDLGSLTITVGNEMLMGDPGGPYHYAGAMWTDKRYDFLTIGSWGHPVAVVDGKLQSAGSKAAATVLETEFSDQRDHFVLDLTKGYPTCEKLENLVRSFTYSRSGAGKVTMQDNFRFTQAATFETALTTLGTWSVASDGSIIIRGKEHALAVRVVVPRSVKYHISGDQVQENGPLVRRIAITLDAPLTSGEVKLEFTPLPL